MTTNLIEQAQDLRTQHHGRQLHLHSVIYPIDYCTSGCTYCGLSTLLADEGAHAIRGGMPPETFSWLMRDLESTGYQIHELVFGTVSTDQKILSERIARWVDRARAEAPNSYLIVNCDTLQPDGYQRLREAGADAIWTFMEIMDPIEYSRKHLSGLKSDQAQRLEAPLRIRDAGMAVGNALLWGLSRDWRTELDRFVEWSKEVGGFEFVATPVQQSVTLTPGSGAPAGFDVDPPLNVTEDLYLEICARLRLAFPETHLVGNTRLDPGFIYGKASQLTDMCNGYVWTGSRSHPVEDLAERGHIHSDGAQMDFYNPGSNPQDIQALCPSDVSVELSFAPTSEPSTPWPTDKKGFVSATQQL